MKTALIIFLIFFPVFAFATDYTVGASTGGWDHLTISSALVVAKPGDTITLQADTVHVAESENLFHNMTLRGATSNHELYIVESDSVGAAVNPAVVVDSTAIIRNIYFRTDEDLTSTFGLIRLSASTADLQIENCEFNGVTSTGGTTIAATTGRLRIRNSRFENCKTTAIGKSAVIDVTPASGVDFIIRNTDFVNCFGAARGLIQMSLGVADSDTLLIADCSFVKNRTSGADGAITCMAIIANGKYLQIKRCTFHDNECGTGADGLFGAYLDIGTGGIDLTQINIVGGDSTKVATADVLHNVSKLNTYGTLQDYIAVYVNGTATDTFHVDPAYLSQAVIPDRWDYRASQSDLVANAIGHIDLTATHWYTDPTAISLKANGTNTYPFASIAAAQGLSNQDTFTIGTGTYTETVTCTLGAALGRYGLTMAGAGGNPRNCRIVSSADIALKVLAGSSVVRNLKFTAPDSVNLSTSARGFVTIMGNVYNDTTAFRNCVVESLTRSGGYGNLRGFAVAMNGLSTATLASLYINAITDTLHMHNNSHTGSALMIEPNGAGPVVVDSCIIANVRSGMPVHFVGVEGNLFWRYNLMADCDAAGADVDEAVMRLCGNTVAGTPKFRFKYSTWYDCNNVVDSLGIVGLHDLELATIDHCIWYGDTKCIENYGSVDDDLDSLSYCNSYGAPFLKASDLSGVAVDTFHVDPVFNCLTISTSCYAATADICRYSNDDSYMGWLKYILPTINPALHQSDYFQDLYAVSDTVCCHSSHWDVIVPELVYAGDWEIYPFGAKSKAADGLNVKVTLAKSNNGWSDTFFIPVDHEHWKNEVTLKQLFSTAIDSIAVQAEFSTCAAGSLLQYQFIMEGW